MKLEALSLVIISIFMYAYCYDEKNKRNSEVLYWH